MDIQRTHASYKVALLCGGKSGEREISLASGKSACEALVQAGHEVTTLDPARTEDLVSLITGGFDVAFLCMHGKFGEDGTLQGFLEMIGLPYTGPNVWSSAVAMDKDKAKVFYRLHGIPTPRSVTLAQGEPYDVEGILKEVGRKCVVKPATEGSALGVFIVEGAADVEEAIHKVFEIDAELVVEQYIHGRELTVAVIDKDGSSQALPVIEIVPKNDFYDFEAKYAPGGSLHLCPAPIDEEKTAALQRLAIQAHRALSCEGVSRTDMILDEEGSPWVLETNTLPGMTETSLLPDAARAVGIEFPDLCNILIESAMSRCSGEA